MTGCSADGISVNKHRDPMRLPVARQSRGQQAAQIEASARYRQSAAKLESPFGVDCEAVHASSANARIKP
jgi:hypothetical protein